MNDIRQVFVPLSEQACVDICAIVETTSNGCSHFAEKGGDNAMLNHFSIERHGDEYYVSLALPSSVDEAMGVITIEGVSI